MTMKKSDYRFLIFVSIYDSINEYYHWRTYKSTDGVKINTPSLFLTRHNIHNIAV